jgi:uncharacterized membrane protein
MSWIYPDSIWLLWAVMVAGVALSIHLEQTQRWAMRITGPILILIGAMALSNTGIMPVDSPVYDFIDNYLVPLAIPLLLFRADAGRIIRETGSLMKSFHVSALGTFIGALLAALLLNGKIEHLPEVIGIMTGSYTGGSVNFVAVKNSYDIPSELVNPLIVADNVIMAAMFVSLLVLSANPFLVKLYSEKHHAGKQTDSAQETGISHWKRKEIGLKDLAAALAVAGTITALSMEASGWIKSHFESRLVHATLGNVFFWMTGITVTAATLCRRQMERIQGSDEIGMYFLYLFFFVLGLRADLIEVIKNVPLLFVLCLIMAITNLIVTLSLGRWLKLPLSELLLSVNATLGGAPSAAAMAIARGWSHLVLPGLLIGIWGYVIGTLLGVLTAELLLKLLS